MFSSTDEIKNRIDIVDFIGSHVQLKRAGSNFKARCPFHNEKSPSFMVSAPKQLWYCFGSCNEGGDIFKFLMKMDGIEFVEALKILADKAGVELPKYGKQTENKKAVLFEVVKEATVFYKNQLKENKFPKDYLINRGLSDSVINSFELGYAPDSWDALVTELGKKFKLEEVNLAGMAIISDRNKGFYDRFRHRIMFPIKDIHGNPVGFTSRLLDDTRKEGKYVNTPETPIYNKGRIIYGLDLARQSIRKNDYVVLVEGNMDVVACHQFGMDNVVASSGTALTFDQVRILKRYTNNIKIAFDADAAGESAARRGIDIAAAQGMRIKVISIPDDCGKDPDDCIRKDINAWKNAVKDAKDIMDFYYSKALAKYDISNAQERSQFANVMLGEIKKNPDAIQRDFWIKKVSETINIDERILHEEFTKIKQPYAVGSYAPKQDVGIKLVSAPARQEQLSKRLLAVLLRDSEYIRKASEYILPEMLSTEDNIALYSSFVACYTKFNTMRSDTSDANFRQFWRIWAEKTAPTLLSTADIFELYSDSEFDNWGKGELLNELEVIINELRRGYTKERRTIIAGQMRQAEAMGDKSRVEELAKEFHEL